MRGILLSRNKANKLVISNSKSKIVRCKSPSEPLNHILQFSSFHDILKSNELQKTATKNMEEKQTKEVLQDCQNLPDIKKSHKNIRSQVHAYSASKPKCLTQSAFKTSPPLKLTLKTQVQIPLQQKKVQVKDQYDDLVGQIVQILKQKYIILQSHISSFNIRKDNFACLLNYLVAFFSAKHKQKLEQIHVQYQSLSSIRQPLNKLAKLSKTCQLKQNEQHCTLQSKTQAFCFSQLDFNAELKYKKNELMTIYTEQENCSKQIQNILKQKNNSISQIKINKKVIQNQLRHKMELEKEIKEYQQQHEKLNAEITAMKLQSQNLQIQSKKIQNFIQDQQNNKIIKMIGEQYKKIEADIYQYAVYLQSNQLASSIDYEPHPFRKMEELINQEMKNLNKSLIQNKEYPSQEKAKVMRDFVLKAMDMFKKKDGEMIKLTQFKTKCIKQFVSNMQKWLDNWSLKQEYLVNLRKEFTIDFKKSAGKITQLKNLKICHQCKPSMTEISLQLERLFLKIEENYKFGNSFY